MWKKKHITFLTQTDIDPIKLISILEQGYTSFTNDESNDNYRIRLTYTYDKLQKSGSLQNDIISKMPRIVNRIVWSRILSQPYNHW